MKVSGWLEALRVFTGTHRLVVGYRRTPAANPNRKADPAKKRARKLRQAAQRRNRG